VALNNQLTLLPFPHFPTTALAVEGFESSALFVQIGEQINGLPQADRQEQVKKVKGVFQFNIKNKEGKVATWTLDLKNGGGAMHKGTVAGLKPDITLDIADSDFVDLSTGKAQGQKLFMSGKIKAKGAIMLATKLDTVLNSAKAKAKL
jgi:putative sterol carrier protein